MDVLAAENVSEVLVEAPNFAVPSGTAGEDDQLVPVFQSAVAGVASHMPSTACAGPMPSHKPPRIVVDNNAEQSAPRPAPQLLR
jgi:hypothetical protein